MVGGCQEALAVTSSPTSAYLHPSGVPSSLPFLIIFSPPAFPTLVYRICPTFRRPSPHFTNPACRWIGSPSTLHGPPPQPLRCLGRVAVLAVLPRLLHRQRGHGTGAQRGTACWHFTAVPFLAVSLGIACCCTPASQCCNAASLVSHLRSATTLSLSFFASAAADP